jgi:hypothetical protein
MAVQILTSSTTLTTATQFIFVPSGSTITITLPASPITGQMLYFSADVPTAVTINPNGKVFRQANADWPTSTLNEFGTTSGGGLTLIYNGAKWNIASSN